MVQNAARPDSVLWTPGRDPTIDLDTYKAYFDTCLISWTPDELREAIAATRPQSAPASPNRSIDGPTSRPKSACARVSLVTCQDAGDGERRFSVDGSASPSGRKSLTGAATSSRSSITPAETPEPDYMVTDMVTGEVVPAAELPIDQCVKVTIQLYKSFIAKPKITRKLLAKPPVSFLRHIFLEVRRVTGFGIGALHDVDNDGCCASREGKLSFLAGLVHLVAHATNDLSLLVNVRVTKIAAGLEPEKTNHLLQRLHCAATDPFCQQNWEYAVQRANEPAARLPRDCVAPPELLAQKLFALGISEDRVKAFALTLLEKATYSTEACLATDSQPCTIDTHSVYSVQVEEDYPLPALDAGHIDLDIPLSPEDCLAVASEQSFIEAHEPSGRASDVGPSGRASDIELDLQKPPPRKTHGRGSMGVGAVKNLFVHSHADNIDKMYEFPEGSILGKGAFGSVTTAISKETFETHAVKWMSKARSKNLDEIRQEVAMMQQIDHPNMVKLHVAFEDAQYIYLCMDYCSGGMLLDRCIQQGSFSEKESAIIMRQIFAANHYLHDTVCMMHRDIKLENFLFSNSESVDTPGNHLKMIDFGESTQLLGQPLTTRIGTPYYVAPEVLAGCYNEMADMWSSGVIAYILLVGYPPFVGNNPQEITQKITAGVYEFHESHWSHVSEDAHQIVAALLTYDPMARLSAVDALHHEWILHEAPRATMHRGSTHTGELLSHLQDFRTKNQFVKLALNALAWNLKDQDIMELKNLFMFLDADDDGTLTIDELKAGLENAGMASASAALLDIMDSSDADGNGVLDYTEFLAATIDRKRAIEEDTAWRVFRAFDTDNNGTIEAHELAKVLASDELIEVMTVDPAFCQQLIQEVDLDGDGVVNFEEFLIMLRGESFTTKPNLVKTDLESSKATIDKRFQAHQSVNSAKIGGAGSFKKMVSDTTRSCQVAGKHQGRVKPIKE